MAMVLLCSLFQARGQEADSTKVMHPVYVHVLGDIKIDAPREIADGEDLTFTISNPLAEVNVWQDKENVYSAGVAGNSTITVPDVRGTILIRGEEESEYVVDGVRYGATERFESAAISGVQDRPTSSNVELSNVLPVGGGYYQCTGYGGGFNQYENVTSITFPNTRMRFTDGAINHQPGLRDIYAKAIDPSAYSTYTDIDIEKAFSGGDIDLNLITVHVPAGCENLYSQTAPWNQFKEVVGDLEYPTEFQVYLCGKGIKSSNTPITVKEGDRKVIEFTLEEGYYTLDGASSIEYVAENIESDQWRSLLTYYRDTQDGVTYYMSNSGPEAYVNGSTLSADVEELVIPAYVTYNGNDYAVNTIRNAVFAYLTRLKKLTIKGETEILYSAFRECTSLKEIHCESKTPAGTVVADAFPDVIKESCIVYVPKGCVEAYKACSWGMFTNIVEEGTVVNTNSIRIEHNPFDTSYLQAGGLDTNPSETAFIYQSEEGAEADVLMRYTIRNYDQWKGHVAISYWEDMSTYGSGQNWIQADISPEGVFEIKVSKDYIADNGQDMFYNNLRVYADQTGELLYDIQAYTNEQLALEAKDNVMTFINPISFTCGLDTIKGTVGEKIQVPITVGEVSSDLAGKEFRIDGDFWLPVDGEGKFHVYRPDGEEVNLVHTGTAGNPAQSIIVSDKDGILMGRLESNQTYTLTLVSDMEISDFHFNMISFQPMADGKDINGTNWTSPYIIDSTKMIETDSTVTDIEVETITIKAETETQITVNFEGVTSGELIVSSETNVNLNLSGDNNLGDVTNNGTLTIQTSTDVTLNATITNNGTLIDETGLITDVAGSAALNIGQMADAEVEDGGTVTLTASANIEIGVTITFQWQRLLNGVWTNVEVNDANAQMLRSASETSTLKVASANAGEYRCLITSTAPVGDTETRAASTTLAAYATVTVTEPVEPEPEPEPAYYTVTLPVVEGATIEAVGSTSVKEGESFSFTVTLKDGYVAADMVVKANGVTLTPDASGRYTIANVRSDVVITVTGIEPDPAVGVEDVETSGLKVWSAAGNLHIQTPEADRAYIVTFGGRVYKIQELPAGETAIPMPRGAYIIYVGGDSFKINM